MKTKSINPNYWETELDVFTLAYMEAALWTERNESQDEDEGEFLDADYEFENFHPDTLAEIIKVCKEFQAKHQSKIRGNDEQAGHDFWLTRNGHGAGFWDRPEIYGGKHRAELLSKAAAKYGEKHLYVGDDGFIYQE